MIGETGERKSAVATPDGKSRKKKKKKKGELCLEDPYSFRNYLRMTQGQFEELCGLVATSVKRQDTNMRLSISVAQRVALTLRFLATGTSSNYIDHTPFP